MKIQTLIGSYKRKGDWVEAIVATKKFQVLEITLVAWSILMSTNPKRNQQKLNLTTPLL